MKYSILWLCFILTGCFSTTKPPETVYIPVSCKTEFPSEPAYRYSPPYDNIYDAVRDLLGDRELSTSYENELKIALKSCK